MSSLKRIYYATIELEMRTELDGQQALVAIG